MAADDDGFVQAVGRFVEAADQLVATVAERVGQRGATGLDPFDERSGVRAKLALHGRPCVRYLRHHFVALSAYVLNGVVEALRDRVAVLVECAHEGAAAGFDAIDEHICAIGEFLRRRTARIGQLDHNVLARARQFRERGFTLPSKRVARLGPADVDLADEFGGLFGERLGGGLG